jgi:curved DNA-binding protein CbpA
VPTVQTFRAWAESLEDATYYTVLRVPVDATPAAIKEAFHAIALRCHPDRFVDEDDALRVAASSVFKRAVEAYRVLSRPELRAEYDRALAAGARRHDPGASMPPPASKRPPIVTLEDLARTPAAKAHCRRADVLISAGRLDDARVSLVTALQQEPENEALKDRLQAVYEALALEPP